MKEDRYKNDFSSLIGFVSIICSHKIIWSHSMLSYSTLKIIGSSLLNLYKSKLTKETDLMQLIKIYKNFQHWIAVTIHRLRDRRVQNVRLRIGNPKDPVESLELPVLFCASPYQEADGSVLEAGVCGGSLETLSKVKAKTGGPQKKHR